MFGLFKSIRFAFYTIVALSAWFLIGARLAAGNYRKAFSLMNEMLMPDWWMSHGPDQPLLRVWLIGLFLLAALLGISFLFCTFDTLLSRLKRPADKWNEWTLFVLHLTGMVLIALHGLSVVAGYKQGEKLVFAGESFVLPDGNRVIVEDVVFVDHRELLRPAKGQHRIRYQRDNYSQHLNGVHIAVGRGQQPLERGVIRYMEPFRARGILFVLDAFASGDKGEEEVIGARIAVVKNPFMVPFFVVYAVAVLLLAVFVMLVWSENRYFCPGFHASLNGQGIKNDQI
jgi:hypothetical protein